MKDKEEILKEFDELSVKEINNGGWNIPYEGIFEPKCREWLSEKLDLAYQQGKADKAREVDEIIESKRQEHWSFCENGCKCSAGETNKLLDDLKQELNKAKE